MPRAGIEPGLILNTNTLYECQVVNVALSIQRELLQFGLFKSKFVAHSFTKRFLVKPE